jgi:putative long chain acyl-CoA synthase
MRWNLPRLMGLARLSGDAVTSFSSVLKRQARAEPERPFFIRGGRAFTLSAADQRVSACMRALIASGVRPGERVRVAVPSGLALLLVVAALNRLGAVAILGQRAASVRADWQIDERPTPGGPPHRWLTPVGRTPVEVGGVDIDALLTDADSLDVSAAESLMPQGWQPDAGLGRDLALVLAPADGTVRRVSNRRWMALALALANRLELKPSMTIWCGVPVDSADGLLLAVGASLVGGARLALPTAREPKLFLREIRHVGASIAFIDAVFADVLTSMDAGARPHHHPMRIIVGRGLDRARAEALKERFGARVRIVRVGRPGAQNDPGDGEPR